MDLKKLIKEYLDEAKLMQLATSVDDQPWVCSVWFTADEDLNIYWFSSTTRRHSHELAKNNKVAGTIVLAQSPKDPPRGLQLQGTAHVIESKEEMDKVISIYKDRIFPMEKINEFLAHKERPHKFYKIKPTQFILFDAVNFPDNPRQEYNLT